MPQQKPQLMVIQDEEQDELIEEQDEESVDDEIMFNEDGMELENQMNNIVDIDKDGNDVQSCNEYAVSIFSLLRQDEVRDSTAIFNSII